MINLLVHGAKGKMGREIVSYINESEKYIVVKEVDVNDDLQACLEAVNFKVDVIIDFTRPEIRMQTVKICLVNKVPVVVGTTGFTPKDLGHIEQWVAEYNTGCFIAPNFIIGNVLMQQFAQKAAEYYECAEIIEYHHQHKVDYPSGTAVKTAELMSTKQERFNPTDNDVVTNVKGARGGEFNGIKLHAIRMPGFIASQEVILGSEGEYLTIRHDSIDRKSYMPGIFRAVDYIKNNVELVYGLEKIL